MIRVRKGDAEQDGGCCECHARGPVLCLDVGHDQLRLCSGCCSTLLAEVVRVDTAAATGKPRRPKNERDADALTVACPLCHAKRGKRCVEKNQTPPNSDGFHFSRIAEAKRGGPATGPTRVRDLAPHTPAPGLRNGSGKRAGRSGPVKVPKPYKARKAG